MKLIIWSCNRTISHKWIEPSKVEDKNRQVNSTQSILFQTNLLWHHNPYNGHTYSSYLTGNVHFVSQTITSTQHENKHLNHLCTIQTLPTSSSVHLILHRTCHFESLTSQPYLYWSWSHWLFAIWCYILSRTRSKHPYLLCHSIKVKLQRHWLRLTMRFLSIKCMLLCGQSIFLCHIIHLQSTWDGT